MNISITVAMDKNGLIGKNNALPWCLPEDLSYFRRITLGKIIVMGRKTFESIGKPLDERENVILTRDKNYYADECIVVNSFEEVINRYKEEEIFVIGGSEIYRQFLPIARRLYITKIEYEFQGDTFFPTIDYSQWKEISRKKGIRNMDNPYNYYFYVYERK